MRAIPRHFLLLPLSRIQQKHQVYYAVIFDLGGDLTVKNANKDRGRRIDTALRKERGFLAMTRKELWRLWKVNCKQRTKELLLLTAFKMKMKEKELLCLTHRRTTHPWKSSSPSKKWWNWWFCCSKMRLGIFSLQVLQVVLNILVCKYSHWKFVLFRRDCDGLWLARKHFSQIKGNKRKEFQKARQQII